MKTTTTATAAITAPRFIRDAIRAAFDRMNAQQDATNPETGKPIINSRTRQKIQTLAPILDDIDAGKTITTARQIEALACLHVSESMTGKLEDVNAISTASSANPICQARSKDCDSICSHCFALLTLDRYNDLEQAAIVNLVILNAMVYSRAAWKTARIPASAAGDIFRIEAFGDTASAIQAANYVIMAATHRHIKAFGIWSKNLGFWASAFEALGKPRNIIFTASSPVMNTPATIPERFRWFLDHVFTVYTSDYAIAHDININCGDRKCANCRRCYKRTTETAVSEIVNAEAKKYYKATGREFTGRK